MCANGGDPWIAIHLEDHAVVIVLRPQLREACLGIYHHCPKLVDLERLSVLANSNLSEQGRSVVGPSDHGAQRDYQGGQQDQRERGGTAIEQVLEHLAWTAQLWVVDVQQGETRSRSDRGPRSSNVKERG